MLDLPRRAYARIVNSRQKAAFFSKTKGIFSTPPLTLVKGKTALRIISMVGRADVQPYLICLKALYRRIGFGQVTAIVDRDLPSDQRALLSYHVPGIELLDLEDIDPGLCQRGGTWERLYHCIERSAESYVIQIDADVLVRATIDEVVDHIHNNRAFTIGGAVDVKPAEAYIQIGKATNSNHIVIEQERAFEHYPDLTGLRYVRGSSGFCGFAKGGFDTSKLEEFHQNMERILGERWREWGTEQVGSNFTIANTQSGMRLPFPKYTSFRPDIDMPKQPFDCSGIHFIGSHRYQDSVFLKMALEEIAALGAAD